MDEQKADVAETEESTEQQAQLMQMRSLVPQLSLVAVAAVISEGMATFSIYPSSDPGGGRWWKYKK